MKNNHHANIKPKKAGVVMLIANKINIKAKKQDVIIKWYIYQ